MRTYRLVHRSEDACAIFALRQSSPWLGLGKLVAGFKAQERRYPAILNWESGVDLAAVLPECAVVVTTNNVKQSAVG